MFQVIRNLRCIGWWYYNYYKKVIQVYSTVKFFVRSIWSLLPQKLLESIIMCKNMVWYDRGPYCQLWWTEGTWNISLRFDRILIFYATQVIAFSICICHNIFVFIYGIAKVSGCVILLVIFYFRIVFIFSNEETFAWDVCQNQYLRISIWFARW